MHSCSITDTSGKVFQFEIADEVINKLKSKARAIAYFEDRDCDFAQLLSEIVPLALDSFVSKEEPSAIIKDVEDGKLHRFNISDGITRQLFIKAKVANNFENNKNSVFCGKYRYPTKTVEMKPTSSGVKPYKDILELGNRFEYNSLDARKPPIYAIPRILPMNMKDDGIIMEPKLPEGMAKVDISKLSAKKIKASANKLKKLNRQVNIKLLNFLANLHVLLLH